MQKPMNTRTIRFAEKDLNDIEKFLSQNPIFDFSSLARLAIRKFIESPDIKVRGIKDKSIYSKKDVAL
jgi:site-specific recombinase XerD